MYADDLILIMKGNTKKDIEHKLKPIIQVIEDFGLRVNEAKTEISQNLSQIKYLGIWLDKTKHIKENKSKALDTFNNFKYIFCNGKLSNALRLHLIKAIIIQQLLYGLDIYNLTKGEIQALDCWINKRLKSVLKIQRSTPTIILRLETRIDPIKYAILTRKANFINKLKNLNLAYLGHNLTLPNITNIDWTNYNKNQLKRIIQETYKEEIRINYNYVDIENPYKNWKVKQYLENSEFPRVFKSKQNYLNWQSSTTLFKLKSYTNGLKRYTYFMEKNNTSKQCPCCNSNKVDNVDHFIWKCPKYKKARSQWLRNIKKVNIDIYKSLLQEKTSNLFRYMNIHDIYIPTIDFLTHSMKIHAIMKKVN